MPLWSSQLVSSKRIWHSPTILGLFLTQYTVAVICLEAYVTTYQSVSVRNLMP